jgi:uridine kinase
MDASSVTRLVEEARPGRPLVLVGIGGHGGAGKSTLAGALPGAQVVPTDAFWDGSWFDLERLRREVVQPLLHGDPARYAAYDWAARAPGGVREVEPAGVVVIEGVCALHRLLRDAYDVRVWVEAPRELCLARGLARDGEEARSLWEEQWRPAEERYVERDDPVSSAHVIVDGSGDSLVEGVRPLDGLRG